MYSPGGSTAEPAPSGNYVSAGISFTITAFSAGSPMTGVVFGVPVTITLHYTDADVQGLDQSRLQVFYLDNSTHTWKTDGIVIVDRDVANHRIVFTIKHLTRFGLFGTTGSQVFLPMVGH